MVESFDLFTHILQGSITGISYNCPLSASEVTLRDAQRTHDAMITSLARQNDVVLAW